MIQLTDQQYEDLCQSLEKALVEVHRVQNEITRLKLRNDQTEKNRWLRLWCRSRGQHLDEIIKELSESILQMRWVVLDREDE